MVKDGGITTAQLMIPQDISRIGNVPGDVIMKAVVPADC